MKRSLTLLMLSCFTVAVSLPGFSGIPGSLSPSSDLVIMKSASGLKSVRQIDLTQAIDMALAGNPELSSLEWDVEAAAARARKAAGKRLPELNLTGAFTHSPDGQRLIAKRSLEDLGVFTRNICTAELMVTLPLFAGGSIVNEMEAFRLLHLVSSQRLARSRNELIFNVTSTFFQILAQKQVVKSIEFSLKSLEQHLATVRALVQAEKAARVDELRTEVRLADISEQLLRARNVLAVQFRVLKNLLGVEDMTLTFQLTGDLATLDKNTAVWDLETAIKVAAENRHDLRALQHEVESLERFFQATKGERYPRVSLQGSYAERWAVDPINVDRDASGNVAYVGISIQLPVYRGGRLKAGIQESRSRLESARNRYRALQQKVTLEVESALLNVEAARKRISASEMAVAQAEESFRIEKLKYQASMGTLVDVLDAQAALLAAQTNYYRALADYHTSWAQLKFNTGEGR
ncbi:MAG: hypothetical protein CO090_05455 [Acidobacteria bacterium CG_4_9_14_3_um_filter_49_7]|nr:MAG: hypothetical protein CO090_05455 [Acidobacteria bacterium CG_4_9_14_3_um_filter_49_7]